VAGHGDRAGRVEAESEQSAQPGDLAERDSRNGNGGHEERVTGWYGGPVFVDGRLPRGDAIRPDQRLECRANAPQFVGHRRQLVLDRRKERRQLQVVPAQHVSKMVEPGGLSLAAEHDPERGPGGEPVQEAAPTGRGQRAGGRRRPGRSGG
jgi:hypothetical protein